MYQIPQTFNNSDGMIKKKTSIRRKIRFSTVKKILKLRSSLSIVLTFFLYTAFLSYAHAPKIITIDSKSTDATFLSTDIDSASRPSFQKAIIQAKKSITLICYAIADKQIIAALQQAATNGVSIQIIYDPTATNEPLHMLDQAVKKFPRKESGLMHHKLLVIDHEFVWISTANMTTSSLTQHGNLTIAFSQKELAKKIETVATQLINREPLSSFPLHIHLQNQDLIFSVHPFQGKKALSSLITRIDQATKRVFVSMYTFTHPELAQALYRAHRRDVDVRILFDKESSKQFSKKIFLYCSKKGLQIGWRTKAGLLHYKTALIDNTLITGSTNWTKAGFHSNDDCMLCIDPLSPSQLSWIEQWWTTIENASTMRKR